MAYRKLQRKHKYVEVKTSLSNNKINLNSNNFDRRSDFFVDLFSDTRSLSPPTFYPKKKFPAWRNKASSLTLLGRIVLFDTFGSLYF